MSSSSHCLLRLSFLFPLSIRARFSESLACRVFFTSLLFFFFDLIFFDPDTKVKSLTMPCLEATALLNSYVVGLFLLFWFSSKNKIFEKILKKNIDNILSKIVLSFEERIDLIY